MELIVLSLIVGGFFILSFYISRIFQQQQQAVSEKCPDKPAEETAEDKTRAKQPQKKQTTDKKPAKDAKAAFNHQWLLTSLKAHSKRILDMDFSPNGRYLATTSEDSTVIIWPVKDFPLKEHKCFRCNVQYDHSLFVKWSPDSKAFVLQKSVQNCVEVYKMTKKPDGGFEFSVAVTFPAKHTTDIIGLGISPSGRFIATCSDKTELIIWDLKGEVLAKVDTYHNLTYCARVSPCGRFVATSGFTSDVKVWEVKFSRSGDFEKIHQAFVLPGHTSGIYSFAFTADSSKMATVSKDGTWKVYNTNIEFSRGQDVTVIRSGKYSGDANARSLVAISPDGNLVALAQDKSLRFYSVLTGECEGEIHDVHTEPITCLLFDNEGKYVLTAGDKHVRVFHNVPGLRTRIQDLRLMLQRNLSNTAARERIEMQIKESEDMIHGILS